jgi:bifunctional DNase/RNase
LPKYHNLKISALTPSSVGATSYILILQSKESLNLSFPIVIGSQEAQSISIFLEGITISRPLTHDLIIDIIKISNLDLVYVSITSFKEGVFYAELHLQDVNSNFKVIDLRPSDAIAIAIRMQKEIRIKDELLETICINSDVLPNENDELVELKFESKSVSELENELVIALTSENYEHAAYLRDQIEKLNSKNEK